MKTTGQGRPKSSADPRSYTIAPDPLVFEALSRQVRPELVEQAVAIKQRRRRRHRKIPAAATVWLVIAMGLWGDADIPGLWRQVVGTLASLWQAALGRKPPTKGALSQARTRLRARPMRRLFKATVRPLATVGTRGAVYKTMPLKAMDGDDYTLPDTPANAKAFGRPSTSKSSGATVVPGGYPQCHVTRLIEVGTRLTLEAFVKPQNQNDHPTAPALLACCARGDLALVDCGYYSYRLIKQAIDQGTFILGPVPCHVVLRPIEHLSDGSYLAKVYPDSDDRHYDRHGVPVRVIEYTFDDPVRPGHGERHRLVTTLLDATAHPAMELIVLYHERWEIEIANDEITTHQLARPVTELRSRTPAGVVQEIYGVLLAHNAVRALMREAALSIDVDPRTLSFIHAVRVIRETIPIMRKASTELLPALYEAMLCQIAQGVLPPRDGRINPRVVKVKMSNFKKKRPEHYNVPKPKPFAASIVMLN
jgi:hypothetical protein